jgi:hypothetical protein
MSAPYWEPLAASPPLLVLPPTYGTSFPASPADGQEHILVDSITNPLYQWRFRYNASSTSAYKWEFVGGPPIQRFFGTNQTNGATLSTWINIVDQTITLPRAGEYIVSGGATLSHPSGGATSYVGLYVGTPSNTVYYSNAGFPSGGGYSASVHIAPYRLAAAAGALLGMSAQSNFANGNFAMMGWQALPVRCS